MIRKKVKKKRRAINDCSKIRTLSKMSLEVLGFINQNHELILILPKKRLKLLKIIINPVLNNFFI